LVHLYPPFCAVLTGAGLIRSARQSGGSHAPRGRPHLYRSQTVTLIHAIASPASEGHVIGVEAAALITCAVRARADKRDLLDDDHNLAALLAVLLPPLLLEASADADLSPFGEVVGRELRRLAKRNYVKKVGFVSVERAINGDREIRNCDAGLAISKIRIAGEPTH